MPALPPSASVSATVPASPPFLRHLRVLASTVADDLGFDVESIEALRVAVDELCALAIADAADGATLTVTIGPTDRGLGLEGRCGPVSDEPMIDPIAEQLLRAGSTDYSLRVDEDHCLLELTADRPDGRGADAGGR